MLFSEQHKRHMKLISIYEFVKFTNEFGDTEKDKKEVLKVLGKARTMLTRHAKTQENRNNKDTWVKELTLMIDPCTNITRKGKFIRYQKEWYKIHQWMGVTGVDGEIYYIKLFAGLDAYEK